MLKIWYNTVSVIITKSSTEDQHGVTPHQAPQKIVEG